MLGDWLFLPSSHLFIPEKLVEPGKERFEYPNRAFYLVVETCFHPLYNFWGAYRIKSEDLSLRF